MSLILFTNLEEKEKTNAVEKLITQGSPRPDFFLMVVLSVAMATFGVLLDSAAVVIGSMLIAPILYPILSFALGVAILDWKLISRSLFTTIKSVIMAVLATAIITFIFVPYSGSPSQNMEILARLEPGIISFAVAVVAGFVASFALVKPHLSETLPGIAISVSLIPPLAVSGVGFALFDWEIMIQSLVLFGLNILGIILASFTVFFLMNFKRKKKVAEQAIKKEDKAIKRERKKALED